ncbi:MAG: ATP-binding cassette domain-containing protein [Bacteroidia bacterium]
MPQNPTPKIQIKGAKTHNLKDLSLEIPHNKFIVVTGISGSGKSSLVFDVIAKEGQRRYFETLPSFARQYMGKINRPDVDSIEGLSPVIAISQQSSSGNVKSTVGTMSDIYDLLRLLFARTGKSTKDISLSRSLFSFNSSLGKCPHCNGIGKEEQIDIDKLIAFPNKSIREGALAPTLPNGYIVYSQVTVDALSQVCEAEGFSVDTPWNQLTKAQQNVVLYGSEKIKVPFGKHSLESRLRWTGIKAKPREEGYYKGMITIMSDILRRDRNANILKYVHAITCTACKGTRLNDNALSVTVKEKTIADVLAFELRELREWIKSNKWETLAHAILKKIKVQIEVLEDLGLGHLTLNRSSKSLSSSEIQRIRVANQILVPLSDVLYVFDEPSIGLHRSENERMIAHFKALVNKGNTVIVVEHDLETIAQADYIIDIGPKAGVNGGELVFNGPLAEFYNKKELIDKSPTLKALIAPVEFAQAENAQADKALRLFGCKERNLKNIDVDFQIGKLNVVSGKSGSGKSTLVKRTLLNAVQSYLEVEGAEDIKLNGHENLEAINKLIFIDHSPIGKTPRSNPATYLGLSDHIRDVFASLPEAKKRKYTKSRFSFNTSAKLSASKGGRCETCQGAGKTQIGMHFLGKVDLRCSTCNGDRFNNETLEIKYKGLSIAEVYRLSVNEAISFFDGQKRILKGLKVLQEIGLGYLTLGQSSTTLSGGEAQRIKIANQLQKKDTGKTLYVIIEPSIGLHHKDIGSLLQLFERIKQKGNTIVCIEQNEHIISQCDWHIELGPESGIAGGEIIHQGKPKMLEKEPFKKAKAEEVINRKNYIDLNGVKTHGLKNINVRIPKNQLTVVTGLSGSGKSSLVYDTLFAEANARFTESLSAYNRSFLQQNSQAKIESFSGLGPAIGINRKGGAASKRSTVGTLSGIYDAYRLLYSRIAQYQGFGYTAQHFSFNHHLGACPNCDGLGVQLTCNPEEVIAAPKKSIFEGAFANSKSLNYYADNNGQFMATLQEAAKQKGWNLNQAWQDLDDEIKQVILFGTGEADWHVNWEYSNKTRKGTQQITAKWKGLCNYINDEFERTQHNKNTIAVEALLHPVVCNTCCGSRLKSELLQSTFLGKNIYELSSLSIVESLELISKTDASDPTIAAISQVVIPNVKATLQTLVDLGLGYLNVDRAVNTLSGGERQRLTLAGQLSSHLHGVAYVLDEPSIGLDAKQVKVLCQLLKKIISKGNTVVVVEHDPAFIIEADYLIEMGPGAGSFGGEIIYQGSVANIIKSKESLSYKLLYEPLTKASKKEHKKGRAFGIKGAHANNLKNIDVTFNSKQLIAVTGVSGSGKSSLIKDVLFSSWQKKRAVNCKIIFGFEQFANVVLIDQELITLNSLSTPASYTGILNDLKILFSKTERAKELGLKKVDFSYQSKKGKCANCSGQGQVKTSMDFMSDIWLTCDVCKGLRYNDEILKCKWQGNNIGQVLQMTFSQVKALFEDDKSVAERLGLIEQLGLGHLQLGQAGNSLSGGEAQRLKLANSLFGTLAGFSSTRRIGETLYLFDEPSTGLHYFDILKLIDVFQIIIDGGNSIIIIEHNKTLIDAANQVLTLGPGSGVEGGEIVIVN